MRLFELAYACRLYGQLVGYDGGLAKLRELVAPDLNVRSPEHRAALFRWLNAWGCRQFARMYWLASSAPLIPEVLVPGDLIVVSQL